MRDVYERDTRVNASHNKLLPKIFKIRVSKFKL